MKTASTLTSVTLLLAATMTIMAGATIAPALPAMAEHFGNGSSLGVRLLLTVTALAIAVSAPFAGWIGDRVGRARVLIASVVVYVIAGGMGLVLDNLTLLQVSRVLLGMSVAGVMTSVSGLIGDLYTGGNRDRMLGLQGAAMGFGGVVFLGLGGVLASYGWRGPFAIYLLPVVLVVLIPLALDLKPHRDGGVHHEAEPDDTPLPHLLLPLLMAVGFLGMVGFYAVPVQLPFLLAARGGDDPILSGALMSGLTLVSALVGLVYGRVARAMSPQTLSIAALASLAAGLSMIPLGSAAMLAGLLLIGLGMGLLMPSVTRWLLAVSPAAKRGRVMGALTSSFFAGQFASPLVLGTVIGPQGLSFAFYLAAASAAVAAGVTCLAALRTKGGTRQMTVH